MICKIVWFSWFVWVYDLYDLYDLRDLYHYFVWLYDLYDFLNVWFLYHTFQILSILLFFSSKKPDWHYIVLNVTKIKRVYYLQQNGIVSAAYFLL